jgi:hypothetical protein
MRNKEFCKIFILISFPLLLFATAPFSFADGQVPGEAAEAARIGLLRFTDSIPAGMEKDFNFETREELLNSYLGSPYRMHTIYPDVLLETISTESDFIIALDEWRFPVINNGKIKALLTVARMDGIWQAVDFGAAGIAEELDGLEKTYLSNEGQTKKIFLRLYQVRSDFIAFCPESKRTEETMYWPLKSGRLMLGLKDEAYVLYHLHELQPLLKDKFGDVLLHAVKERQKRQAKKKGEDK